MKHNHGGSSRPPKHAASVERLHPRSVHRGRYDFDALQLALPALTAFMVLNQRGEASINFSSAEAVKCLNQALLAHHYQIRFWDFPPQYLCPPIPGRADTIHYAADLLAAVNGNEIPRGKGITLLDVGTGANCIYPILAHRIYGWRCIGSDIHLPAVKSAQAIVQANHSLKGAIKIKHQTNALSYFANIIADQAVDMVVCNPPFHASEQEAQAGTRRKNQNLARQASSPYVAKQAQSNFSGQAHELWCSGGEIRFLTDMIVESADFKYQVGWFSSLVSKSNNVPLLKKQLAKLGASQLKLIKMQQGQKQSHLLAWSFVH